MSGKKFVDTNVLVHAFDRHEQVKRRKSRALLRALGPPRERER